MHDSPKVMVLRASVCHIYVNCGKGKLGHAQCEASCYENHHNYVDVSLDPTFIYFV